MAFLTDLNAFVLLRVSCGANRFVAKRGAATVRNCYSCSLKCAELTIGAKERRRLLRQV